MKAAALYNKKGELVKSLWKRPEAFHGKEFYYLLEPNIVMDGLEEGVVRSIQSVIRTFKLAGSDGECLIFREHGNPIPQPEIGPIPLSLSTDE